MAFRTGFLARDKNVSRFLATAGGVVTFLAGNANMALVAETTTVDPSFCEERLGDLRQTRLVLPHRMTISTTVENRAGSTSDGSHPDVRSQ